MAQPTTTLSLKPKSDKYLMNIIKLGVVFLTITIIYLVFVYFVKPKRRVYERFSNMNKNAKYVDTIYEQSIRELYSENPAMLCNMLMLGDNCDKKTMKKFPVHIIKHLDGTYLSVFNDGQMYRKQFLNEKMWYGPLDNSMPGNGEIPLRMITIAPNGIDLVGVAYDNQLYIKRADPATKFLDVEGRWELVPNNNNIIYVLTDPYSTRLVAINTEGQILINTKYELESDYTLASRIQTPVLRLYFDSNGYMLIIDTNFNLYQMKDLDWRNSNINYERGANPVMVHDILYDNDMKFWGLVFIPGAGILDMMKQNQVYYLSRFTPPELHFELGSGKTPLLMNDIAVIKAKTGVDLTIAETESNTAMDDDINHANMRQILENKKKLREFCAQRSIVSVGESEKYNNFALKDQIDQNDAKLTNMRGLVDKMLAYDPDSQSIKDSVLVSKSNI